MLFWSPGQREGELAKEELNRLSKKYPSVKLKFVDVTKDPQKPVKHNVEKTPTVLLLRDGREVDRHGTGVKMLLEQTFRKAHV